jgi:anaerobic magnesium-protoporphyrin IX monomethyl ester cyclase
MNILLVNPPARQAHRRNTMVVPPLGLAYLAAVLRQAGYQVKIKDAFAEGMGWEEFAAYLAIEKPEILGLTSISTTIDQAFKAIRLARPHVRTIIMGGPHISVWGQKVFAQCPDIDLGVVGEGEETIVELVDAIAGAASPEGIPGVIGRDFVSPPRRLIRNLDGLPFPARDLLPLHRYIYPFSHGKHVTTLFTSRGCPYHCIFCDKSIFGSNWRGRSADNILAELDEIYQIYGLRSLVIYDDLFTLDEKRVHKICEGILARGYKLDWKCESRVNLVDLETLKLMKRAGCSLIAYGVESGNQKGLDYINKNITLDQIRQAFALTHAAGLDTLAYFILGIPVETYEDEVRTIQLACELNPTYAQFATLSPYYGTRLYQEAVEKGWYQELDVKNPADQDLRRPAIISPNWSAENLEKILRRAHLFFYLRPSYIFRRITTVKSPAQFLNAARGFLTLGRWLAK